MAGVNKAIILGNLGRDPEVRVMQSGEKVCNFNVATSETWKDKSGERKEKTEWHNITVWNQNLVTIAEKYLKKGSKVYLEGKIQTESYEKDGEKKYTTKIVLDKFGGALTLLDGRSDDDKPTEHEKAKANAYQPKQGDLDSDIPF